MYPAKRLWLWHKAKEALQADQAKWEKYEARQRQHQEKIALLESKLAAVAAPVSPDEQISRMLLEQELWLAKKEQERYFAEQGERQLALAQELQQRKYDVLELEQQLEEELLQEYYRVAEYKEKPLAEVKNKCCMGCYLTLPLSKVNEWRRGKGLVCCDECGRILV